MNTRNAQDNDINLYSLHELECMKARQEKKQYNPFTPKEIKEELIKRTITPHCQKLADKLIKCNYSDTYIQSQMYASRDQNTSIEHIVKAIEIAKGNKIN